MSSSVSHHLVKAIADVAIFLEFTNEKLLDPDAAMEAMEQLAAELQRLKEEDRGSVVQQLKSISAEYLDKSKAQFVENLPEALGLE